MLPRGMDSWSATGSIIFCVFFGGGGVMEGRARGQAQAGGSVDVSAGFDLISEYRL